MKTIINTIAALMMSTSIASANNYFFDGHTLWEFCMSPKNSSGYVMGAASVATALDTYRVVGELGNTEFGLCFPNQSAETAFINVCKWMSKQDSDNFDYALPVLVGVAMDDTFPCR